MVEFNINAEVIGYIVGNIAIAGAIYGGIRADIKNMNRRIDDVHETADSAHRRIDDFYSKRVTR